MTHSFSKMALNSPKDIKQVSNPPYLRNVRDKKWSLSLDLVLQSATFWLALLAKMSCRNLLCGIFNMLHLKLPYKMGGGGVEGGDLGLPSLRVFYKVRQTK